MTLALSIQRRTKFQDALAGAFHMLGKRNCSRIIEQQNYAVQFAFTGPSGQRRPNGMKEFAAANPEPLLKRRDDLFEVIGIEGAAFEKEQSGLAQDVASGVAR